MARKPRAEFEGAIAHVTVRGVDRRMLFRDDADRERFLANLGEAVEETGVRLYLYCLMANHVHLVVETPGANLSAFMHKLETGYTLYFNRWHGRVGHLTQGRYHAKPVQGTDYLLRLTRYVHLNPVHVGARGTAPVEERQRRLREYAWSSYRGYAGLTKPREFVSEGPVLALLEAEGAKARRAYRRFVEAGLAENDEEFMEVLKSARWGIGDEAFQEQLRDRHTDRVLGARRREDVAFRRVAPACSVEAVLKAVAQGFGMSVESLTRRQYDSPVRAVAARMLVRHAGLNQRDAGAALAMGTGAAVSDQLKRLRERLAHDEPLDRTVAAIRAVLEPKLDS